MVRIGIDPHKQTHCAVAVNALGVQIAQRTVAARVEGFGELVEWGRAVDPERVWVVEDVRHVSGSLERFLLDRGETIKIAGIDRFTSDAQLARISGCAPIPSPQDAQTAIALTWRQPATQPRVSHARAHRLMHDPQTAAYIQKQREHEKTNKEALRNLKRHLVRRIYHPLKDPQRVPITVCLT